MKIAVYAGTFDPITNGHVSVVKQGLRLFDRMIVAVARNTKKNPIFTVEERIKLIKQSLKGSRRLVVTSFEHEMTADYAERMGANFLLRGLRNNRDFEEEREMQILNHTINPRVPSTFIMSDPELSVVSSSTMKEFLKVRRGSEIIAQFVPKPVFKKLMELPHE